MEKATKYFLVFVGIAYLGLGIWCTIDPTKTSNSVGFDLQPGHGQSEYLTVYGGLEVALGIIFLWPVMFREDLNGTLRACLILHACLVLFRTIGFFLFTDIKTTTFVLASVEWILFLGSITLFLSNRKSRKSSSELTRASFKTRF